MEDCRIEKQRRKRHMKLWVNSSVIVSILSLSVQLFAQSNQYTYSDLNGIWVLDYNMKSTEDSDVFGNEFFVFKDEKLLIVATHKNVCMSCIGASICTKIIGFSNTLLNSEIDTIHSVGEHITEVDSDGYWAESTHLTPRTELVLGYNECSYINSLPQKAKIVLYENSQKDHRNYAREFLDYDICGVKAEDCQILDSLQHPIGIAIAKDDIVVVRDTSGEMLKVEYEDVPGHVVYGYIKRKDLIFVDEECNATIVE